MLFRSRVAMGAKDAQTVRIARGNPQNPLSPEQRVSKALLCLEPALGGVRARALVDAIDSLEKQRDVRELARGLA